MLMDCMLPCASSFNGLVPPLLENRAPSSGSSADLVRMDRTLPCLGCSALSPGPAGPQSPSFLQEGGACGLHACLHAARSLPAAPCSRQLHLVNDGGWPE